ncbi:hypothetical protein ABTK33_20795, partial [Acinetobacter baumannii]
NSFGDDDEDHSNYQGGSFQKEMDLVTDANGRAVVEFDTKQSDDQETPETNLRFGVDISMTDASNKYASQTGSVLVTRGAFDL